MVFLAPVVAPSQHVQAITHPLPLASARVRGRPADALDDLDEKHTNKIETMQEQIATLTKGLNDKSLTDDERKQLLKEAGEIQASIDKQQGREKSGQAFPLAGLVWPALPAWLRCPKGRTHAVEARLHRRVLPPCPSLDLGFLLTHFASRKFLVIAPPRKQRTAVMFGVRRHACVCRYRSPFGSRGAWLDVACFLSLPHLRLGFSPAAFADKRPKGLE